MRADDFKLGEKIDFCTKLGALTQPAPTLYLGRFLCGWSTVDTKAVSLLQGSLLYHPSRIVSSLWNPHKSSVQRYSRRFSPFTTFLVGYHMLVCFFLMPELDPMLHMTRNPGTDLDLANSVSWPCRSSRIQSRSANKKLLMGKSLFAQTSHAFPQQDMPLPSFGPPDFLFGCVWKLREVISSLRTAMSFKRSWPRDPDERWTW